MNLENIDLKDKKVIIRCDFNVPIKNGIIEDDNRIVESLPTINLVKDKGAKIILMSHLGRVQSVEDKINKTLKPVADRLSELLNQKIIFVDETRGEKLEQAINNLKNGDIILFHNNAKYTPGNLDKIILKLSNDGYEFKTISEMIYKNGSIDDNGIQHKSN